MHEEPHIPDPDDAPRLLMPGIMGAVGFFAVVVAGGVYGKTGKLLALPVVLGTVGAFLLLWYVALRRRLRFTAGEDQMDDADEKVVSPTVRTAVRSVAVILLAVGCAGLEGGIIQALRKGEAWEPLPYLIFVPIVCAALGLLLWGERLSSTHVTPSPRPADLSSG